MRFKFWLLFISSLLFGQKHISDFQLKGRVKQLESTTYSSLTPTQTDVSGFLDSEFYNAVKLEFDVNGNLISKENYLDYHGKLGLFDKTIFQYNPQNQLEKQTSTLVQNGEEPTKVSQIKKYYYLKGQLIRMDEFNFGRTTDQIWTVNYKYNRGQLYEKEFWMEDKVFSKEVYNYDLGRIEKIQTIHNDGKPGQTSFFQYVKGKLIGDKIFQTGNEKTKESFYYNGNTLTEMVVTYNEGEVLKRIVYNPEALPQIVEEKDYRKKTSVKRDFGYEFDKQGNWVRCFIKEEGIPKYEIIRKIIYH